MRAEDLDPELAIVVPFLPVGDPWDVPGTREMVRQMVLAMSGQKPLGAKRVTVEDRDIPGPEGAPDVAVRLYWPTERPKVLPGIVHCHGGGFTIGDLDQEHGAGIAMADGVGAVVVCVGYRLAPENPFPAGVEDCYAALEWSVAHAAELGIDATRIAVEGGSAGGALAAALTLMSRDRDGPPIAFQALNIPSLDDRLTTPSMREFVDTPMLTRATSEAMWQHYLGSDRSDVSPYAAPARATDLRGLPPALIQVAEYDPLRDEGIDYARRLLEAGVSVELHLYPRAFHGFELVHTAAVSRRHGADRIAALRKALHPAGSEGERRS